MALIALGMSDDEIGSATGIPRRTVSDWRHGKRPRRHPLRRAAPCFPIEPSDLPEAEYAYLLGLYLGDGYLSRGPRDVWRLRISLDGAYPNIISACEAALEAVFPDQHAHRYARTGSRCIDVSIYSKRLPRLFPQHGPGRKHRRPIRLADWQSEIVGQHRKPFLRGLIHSDGCRIVATERKGSYVRRAPRYAFSNLSEDIKRLFCESCDALGIHWTRPSDRQIAVYRLDSVAILDEFVGPKG